jgi:hypothetical protein
MLIAGFVLATAFIALALVLNSVIYTENLATRDTEARGSEAATYRADVADGAEALIEYANGNITVGGESYADIRDDFQESLRAMSNGTGRIQATDGERTAVRLAATTSGTRIGQFNDSDRDFTSDDDETTWRLARDVSGTRAYRINVTDSGLLPDAGSLADVVGDSFTLNVTDGTDKWNVSIYQADTTTETVVDVNGDAGGECVGSEDAEIDLTAGTVDSEPCEALLADGGTPFGSGVDDPYELYYDNADQMVGNFSAVLNASKSDVDLDANYDQSTTATPFAVEAIYAAKVTVIHESADLVYTTDVRAIPGEIDD